MRFLNSIVLLAIAVVWSFSAEAREAKFLDFSNKPAAVLPDSAVSPNAAIDGVAQPMRAHFEQNRVVVDIQGDASFGFDLGNLPTKGLAIPRWMRDRRSASATIVSLPQGFESGLIQGAFDQCDDARYVPTWWLSRDVESRRASHYDAVAAIACEFGLPTNLLDAVIAQESGYKSWAVSSAGAMGIMQIMPGTARSLSLALPFDPIANMRAGARYLRQQINRFGRIDLALAAYNAGPERRSLKMGYIPAIPETRHYVRAITTNWARLASRRPEIVTAEHRGEAALIAVRASGYRSVELISYDGSNAANPM